MEQGNFFFQQKQTVLGLAVFFLRYMKQSSMTTMMTVTMTTTMVTTMITTTMTHLQPGKTF